jgi:hypothetical protein
VRTRGLITVALVVMTAAGCGGGSDEAEPVKVQGDEYAFVMPAEAEAGVVSFQVSNAGDELHEYALGRLDAGKTVEDVKAFLASGGEDAPEWFTDVGGVPLLSPGEELTLTRKLPPATYVFLCFLPSPSGEPHVALGMLKSLELTGDSGSALPEPDAVIKADATGYDIPALKAGHQTIELRNADDRERVLSRRSVAGEDPAGPRALLRAGRKQGQTTRDLPRRNADDPGRQLRVRRNRSSGRSQVHTRRQHRRRTSSCNARPQVSRGARCPEPRRVRLRPGSCASACVVALVSSAARENECEETS